MEMIPSVLVGLINVPELCEGYTFISTITTYKDKRSTELKRVRMERGEKERDALLLRVRRKEREIV